MRRSPTTPETEGPSSPGGERGTLDPLELALVAVAFLIHLPVLTDYGWFRDELYYVASTRELAWGYVDHPPLSILVLDAWTRMFGHSLTAVRLLPPLLGAVAVFLTGRLARRLGGGRFARVMAMLCTLSGTLYLYLFHVYSMNALDVLVWTGTALILIEILRHRPDAERASLARWIGLGLLLGLGLQNKISVLWLGAGLAAALVLEEPRRLRRAGPWAAGCLALAMFAPYVIWNGAHGWPTLEFMDNAMNLKMLARDPMSFVGDLLLYLNPGTAPVWLAGLAWLLLSRPGRPWRSLAVVWLTVLAILLLAGSARTSYMAPAFPMLFAAGGVAVESWSRDRPGARALLVAAVVGIGMLLAPFTLPVLAPASFVSYSRALGVAPTTAERHVTGPLPQHYADMYGWDSLVASIADVAATLSPEERGHTIVFGQNYGEAGAVDVIGRPRGLPPAASGHNSYWSWGARGVEVRTVIAIGGERDDYLQAFASVELAGRARCHWCMPYESDLPIWIARDPKAPFDAIWPTTRHLD